MADNDKGTTKQGPEGLGIGEHLAKAFGGGFGWFLSGFPKLFKTDDENYYAYHSSYKAANYLVYGRDINSISERDGMAILSPRAGFIFNLENAEAQASLLYNDSEAKAARMRKTVIEHAGKSLFYDHDVKGNNTGTITKALPYEERMGHLKWLITDFGFDPNIPLKHAILTDQKMADWLLEKGGADINHIFKEPYGFVMPITGANQYLFRMKDLMIESAYGAKVFGQRDPRANMLPAKDFQDAADPRIAAIYADPILKYITQKGGGMTADAKPGAVSFIFATRSLYRGNKSDFTQGIEAPFDAYRPHYDVIQREGLKNGVNVFATPKLLDQAIERYKDSSALERHIESPEGALQKANAKTYYAYVINNGYKTVTPAMLDDVVSHWKSTQGRPDVLSALIQEGRLSKDQLIDLSGRLENEPGNKPTMEILKHAINGTTPAEPTGAEIPPELLVNSRNRTTQVGLAMGMQ